MNGLHLSPDDGLNLNRVIPGNPFGSLAERIAHMVTCDLISKADHVIDLHSGGRSLNFAPSVLLHEVEGAAMDKALSAAMACNAPFTALSREDHADVMIDAVVESAGKVMIATELGGAGTASPATAQIAKQGFRGCLASLGHLAQTHQSATTTQLVSLPSGDANSVSDVTMIFEPSVQLGQRVEMGETLGVGHILDRANVPPAVFIAPRNGWFVCSAGEGIVHRGDVVAIVSSGIDG